MYKLSKAEKTKRAVQNLERHLKDLENIGYNQKSLIPLRKLENKANEMATNECNGTHEYSTEQWNEINQAVLALFNVDIRNYGFFINMDPRGCSLKLKNVEYENRVIQYTDWGGYQILAPEFN